MIRFACPGCGAIYAVEGDKAGKTGMCPTCRAQFVIPAPDGPPPAGGRPPLPPDPPRSDALPPPPPVGPPPVLPPPLPRDEPVEVNPCPGCGARLSVLAADLGVTVECPHCKTAFTAARAGSPAGPVAPRTSHGGKPGAVGDLLASGSQAADGRRTRRGAVAEDDRPSRRSRRGRYDEDEDDEDDRSWRRSGRPGNIAAVGGMLLGGAIYGLIQLAVVVVSSVFIACLWPGVYFGLVWAILAIVRGAQLLNQSDAGGPPRLLCILQIVMILNCDVVNLILGIVGLVLLNSPEVEEYYERQGSDVE